MKTVYGFGILDMTGIFRDPAYEAWRGMLRRCYDKAHQEKKPAYIGCTVDDRWKVFSVFKQWFDERSFPKCQVDKDLLSEGNKVYGPDLCVLIPSDLNLFTHQKRAQGKYPIGVSKSRTSNFYTSTAQGFGDRIQLNGFNTTEEAHQGWKDSKRFLVEKNKEYIDKFDSRLYDALVSKYS